VIDTSVPAWLWPVLLAPFAGSFLGVLIARLPVAAPIAAARSACPQCGTRLGVIDLVPFFSFVLLRGRCRHCRAPIGVFHPAVELAAVAVAVWAVLADADPIRVWADCGLGWTLLTLAWIDWTDFLLPDVLTLPLIPGGLTITWAWDPDSLPDRCLAAALAYLSFQGLAWAYRRLRGWDGLGGGDAKLIAAAGAWCGSAVLPLVVLASALFGLLAALGLMLAGRTMTSTTRIPFGPCIALAFWLVWIHGELADDLIQMMGRWW
jgi:leader peptidase (prepilin peptidase) / N-methyltransferase